MSEKNQNLMFFIQPSDSAFTDPERIMKTYLNRFMISEHDQVEHKYRMNSVFYTHNKQKVLIVDLSLRY